MFQPGKWLFDLFRFGGFALVVGGVLVMLNRVQASEPLGGDGFALVILGGLCIVISARLKQRRESRDKSD